jgi:hypothetical protein
MVDLLDPVVQQVVVVLLLDLDLVVVELEYLVKDYLVHCQIVPEILVLVVRMDHLEMRPMVLLVVYMVVVVEEVMVVVLEVLLLVAMEHKVL